MHLLCFNNSPSLWVSNAMHLFSVSIVGKVIFSHLLIAASLWLLLMAVDVPWKFYYFTQEIFHICHCRTRDARSPL